MKKVLIINAIIWAIVIVTVSQLTKDSDNNKYLLGIMLVGFVLQNGLTYSIMKNMK